MREKNRKPIASYIKLPQFTTMNVIDGQAGLIIYASLIFYSLTIDNILNIIVLLILAGVTIVTLTGDNGLLTKASNAKNTWKEGENEEQSRLSNIELYLEKNTIGAEELLNDDQFPQLKPIITTWKTEEANEIITLPLIATNSYNYDCTIDYGDGTEIQTLKGKITESPTHIYENVGSYNITITGTCTSFDFITVPASAKKIVRVEQFGATNLKNLSFCGCTNLEKIVEPSNNSFINLNTGTFAKMFYNCSKLESIPEKLFLNVPNNVTDLSQTFCNCSNIKNIPENLLKKFNNVTTFATVYNGGTFTGTSITSIPENLFKYNTKVTRFHGTFSNCKELLSIPENLFSNNINVSYFGCASGGYGCFTGCTNLKTIPARLFANNMKVVNFIKVFSGCSSLEEIPKELFSANINAKEFLGTFQGCTNLKSIPEGLFDNNTEVTTFRGCFSGCKNLEYLPEGLFDNCQKVESFYYTFYNCSKMQGTAPALWKRKNIDTSKEYNYRLCFRDCKMLSNYNDIPNGWK